MVIWWEVCLEFWLELLGWYCCWVVIGWFCCLGCLFVWWCWFWGVCGVCCVGRGRFFLLVLWSRWCWVLLFCSLYWMLRGWVDWGLWRISWDWCCFKLWVLGGMSLMMLVIGRDCRVVGWEVVGVVKEGFWFFGGFLDYVCEE